MASKRALALFILMAASAAGEPGIAGRWIGYFGATLHTWDFKADGSFSHVFIGAGSGTRLLNEEKGSFAVEDESLVLSNVDLGFGDGGAGPRRAQLPDRRGEIEGRGDPAGEVQSGGTGGFDHRGGYQAQGE